MMIEVWRCSCGMSHSRPWTTCFRCNPEGRRIEANCFREASVEAMLLDIDRYSDGILARTEAGLIVRVRDVGLAMRLGGAAEREELVGASMRLKDENRELLAENARLVATPIDEEAHDRVRHEPNDASAVPDDGLHRVLRPHVALLGMSLNDLTMMSARMGWTRADWSHFSQLHGYSVSGWGDLSYASDAEWEAAAKLERALLRALPKDPGKRRRSPLTSAPKGGADG